MIVVVMGVSGVGKTTIGSALAARLGCDFLDGDDWHPAENVVKMTAGTPLTDDDRWPWLDRLNAELRRHEALGESAVLACSALKESYRERLLRGVQRSALVFLHGSFELILDRIESRRHRYMPASLLESQFAALEPPAKAIAIDVAQELKSCLDRIASALRR